MALSCQCEPKISEECFQYLVDSFHKENGVQLRISKVHLTKCLVSVICRLYYRMSFVISVSSSVYFQLDLGTPSFPHRLVNAVARRQAAVIADLDVFLSS